MPESKRRPKEAAPDTESPAAAAGRSSARGLAFPHDEDTVHPPGSIGQLSFRFTRGTVVLARRWQTLVDERLGAIGQTQARWETLFAILRTRPAPTQRELAQVLGVEAPTLVRVLHRLEEEELIERCPVEGDRRAWTIRLRPGAESVVAQCSAVVYALRAEYLGDIAPAELETCLSVIDRVLARLEKSGGPEPRKGSRRGQPVRRAGDRHGG